MKNKFVKALATIMSVAALAGPIAAPVFAATTNTAPTANLTTTFTKYIGMAADANVPNQDFTYSITPAGGTASTADNIITVIPANAAKKTAAVYAGIGTPRFQSQNDISVSGAHFEAGMPTTTGSASDSLLTDTAKKYAKDTVTVGFDGIQFPEPGIYRYVIADTTTDLAAGITNDYYPYMIVDVYVEDAANNGNLTIGGYIMHKSVDDANGLTTAAPTMNETSVADSTKASGFDDISFGTKDFNDDGTMDTSATYDTNNLTFSKTVTGNQGSRDKYFKFTLAVSGAKAGTRYYLDLSNADVQFTALPNAATTTDALVKATADAPVNNYGVAETVRTGSDGSTVTATGRYYVEVGTDGTISQDFYIKNGQSIVVQGIAPDTAYTLTEAEEDYTPFTAVTGDTEGQAKGAADVIDISSGTTDSVTDSDFTKASTVAFTNTRQGAVPTGVILSMAPYLIGGIAAVGAGTTVAITKSRKKAKKNDDAE